MAFFDNDNMVTSEGAEVEMEKALKAGYGTDTAVFTDGRALQREDLESTVLNVLAQTKEDAKVFNTLKKEPVKSTVHEYNRRTEMGDYKYLSVDEGGESPETNQSVERKFVNMKYLQTRRAVTEQAQLTSSFEDAYATEKICGVETIIKGAEHMIFHGDSDIIPTEFDGFEATLRKAKNTTIKDWRGSTIAKIGERGFDDVAREVWDKNGELDKVMFPSVLSGDIKELFNDRLRFDTKDSRVSFTRIPDYPTAIGATLRFAGEDTGADKFFDVKGKVKAEGNSAKRPQAPSAFTAKAGETGSKFGASDNGSYMYVVHAINAYGISEGKKLDMACAVTAGQQVTLTITPALSGPKATGYIICRAKKDVEDEKEAMEMVRVADSGSGTTKYIDTNEELPGTASMILLPRKKLIDAYKFAQLLPCSTYPLYTNAKAEKPFLVMLYGALEVGAPEHCAMIKNIAYNGGIVY